MNKYKTFFYIPIFFVLFSCYQTETPSKLTAFIPTNKIKLSPATYKTAKNIERFFDRRFKLGVFNGTVLFAEKGLIVFKKAYGFANFRKKDSLRTNSSFQLASVSKPLAAVALLMLIEEGKLSLEDSLGKFIPGLPYHNIKIEQLLAHRSGLPEYMYFADKYWEDKHVFIHNDDIIDLMKTYKPLRYYKPGVRYNYSNTNYALIASVIEKVSGKSFSDFMNERIFEPLGMKNTYIYNGENVNNKVVGYITRRKRAGNTYLNGVVGDKGIYSSVEDLHVWNTALDNGLLIDKELMKKSFTPYHKELRIYDNYGFGWRINAADSTNKIVYHTGWWKGFRSYYIKQLGKQRTLIILTNISKVGIFGTKELIELF